MFWISNFFTRITNYSYENNLFLAFLRRGVITLLPKSVFFIGECLRTMILELAKNKKKTGMDFEKAFDLVSLAFINKIMLYLGFGDWLVKWANTEMFDILFFSMGGGLFRSQQ